MIGKWTLTALSYPSQSSEQLLVLWRERATSRTAQSSLAQEQRREHRAAWATREPVADLGAESPSPPFKATELSLSTEKVTVRDEDQ